MNEFDYVVDNEFTRPRDDMLFFATLDEEKAGKWITTTPPRHIPSTWNMSDIAVDLQLFPSKNQARKNGWNTSIPKGFSIHTMGKMKYKVAIYNPIDRRKR